MLRECTVFAVLLSFFVLILLEQQFPSGQFSAQDQWFLPSATTPVIVSPSESDSREFKIVAQTARITDGDDGSSVRSAGLVTVCREWSYRI